MNSLKGRIRKYSEEEIVLKHHALLRVRQRQLSISEVKKTILNTDKLIEVERESKVESKYKLTYKYDPNTKLGIVIVMHPNRLRVLTVWRGTSNV